ncbi:hypothetical protein AWV79_35680 [Cupriavidus sp. UYMMa02A]|nr:hypothetical protein AWV79_35680 [Cupriavidus sp. UYMMa02A]
MQTPESLRFTALEYGFHARGPGMRACFLEAQWDKKAKAITWHWRIHNVNMSAVLANGHAATPEEAEAAMRAWLTHASDEA